MNLTDLLADLSARGARVWAEGGQLRLRAPKGALTPELEGALSEHKGELLALLGQQSAERDQARPLKPRSAESAPLSFMQERLWFLWQMYPQSAVYNLPNARRLRGPLQVDALREAVREIIQRHEALRTVFVVVDGEAEQRPTNPPNLVFEVVDLSAADDPEAEADRIAHLEAGAAFDLKEGPPVRAKLLRLGEEDHLFLWSLHHAVSDGWSSILFLRELKALYEAGVSGRPAELPVPGLHFADFAEWEREWMSGEVLEGQLDYWKQKLGGAPDSVLELPADHRRPPVLSYRGKCRPLSLSEPLVDELRALAQDAGVTLYMVLLAGLKVLLSRQTGQSDICVGSPIARRNRPELEDVIGCFVNTLVLRTDLSGDPSVRELLSRVRATSTEAFAHQDVPLEKLIEELQPPRDTGHTPLFQVMFTLHVQDTRKVSSIGDVSIEAVEYHAPTSKFDLTVELKETAEGLEGWFEYSTDLFEEETIGRLVGQYTKLLEGMVEHRDSPVSALPLASDVDVDRVVREWNDTDVPYAEDATLAKVFEDQVARTPDAVALVYEGEELTYGQLNGRANQLAHRLIRLGVGPDHVVAVCMRRSVELVVALYGIVKAGGAYLPVDPDYPAERVRFMLEDAEVGVVLTTEADRSALPVGQSEVVTLDGDGAALASEAATNPERRAAPEHLAYVIYTSGSTGRPKGVMNEHRGICNRLFWMQDEYGLDTNDRVLQKTPFTFDVSVWEFFWPLQVGARLVVSRPGGHRDSRYLSELIHEQQLTTLHFVPSMLQLFVGEADVDQCASLTRVFSSGEALPVDLAARWLERFGTDLHNLYGPTEAAIDVTYWKCELGTDSRSVPIGRPVANTRIYVLDEHLKPVPIHVPGELHIGGVQVARGYLNRPELNREKFIGDPFDRRPGARLYKTGDLARWRPDGTVEYVGRIDHQVKLRGLRIELGEIETILADHAGVRESVVLLREDVPGDPRLVAYVTARESGVVAIPDLNKYLKRSLPEYMVPAATVVLAVMPLLPNGKVDRRALPQPSTTRPDLEVDSVPPRTPTEELVAGIWADVLGVDQVGVHDSFFDLGGHSLMMTKVSSRLAESLGVQLSLMAVFERPTVAGLTEYILGQQLSQSGDDELSRMLDELERS